ncbi:hypothetical protein C499_15560 [Halogeometricum borinquense DSM 11551]|uniref:Uncharacterized protein n=2 Tax=Halogeometricum borinquense TaxID=60847 RepID=E4NSN5_HALBP|nr:hypothetical protein [Halogeometricum borinquense]ADQ68128.1 hypothetical protein Hbor_25750 [Halogeometricum borinquense DSM 11551]ELY24828.1 hypothetical protein C499_15560 [Halogeometricum borinquense DSM 11551]RYJ12967.1 hypothetical protein ELS19_02605 [Halogeometricum borinquense]
MNTTKITAGVGVIAVLGGVAGLAGFVVPGLSATFVFVIVVGLVAGAQGLRYALGRRSVDYRAADTGDPELRYRVPTPGDDVDRRLSKTGWRVSDATNLRMRLRESAIQTLVFHDNCSADVAERHVEEGTWTTDPVAARYLGADVSLSLVDRVRLVVRGQSSTAARAARTIDAIESVHESDDSVTEAHR